MTAAVVAVEDEVPALAAAAAENAERTDKRRRRWGCLLYAALAFTIPMLIVASVCFWIYLQDRLLAHEAMARARAAGDPMSAKEFQAAFYPTSPEVDEATRRWNRAAEVIGRLQEGPLVLELPGVCGPNGVLPPGLDERGFYDEPTLGTIDAFLSSVEEDVIELIHSARRGGGAPRIASDLSGDMESAVSSSGPFVWMGLVLVYEAERQAVRGDLEATTEALVSLAAVNDACAGDTTDFFQLSYFPGNRAAYKELRRMIELVDFSDDQLRRLDEAVAKADFREALVRRFQTEQYRVVRAIETNEPMDDRDLKASRELPLRGADAALAIENFQELLDGAKVDLESARKACDRMDKRLAPLYAPDAFQEVRYRMAVATARDADPDVRVVMQAEADRRLTRALIACERYRLQYGAWPATLEALVPEFAVEIPQDVLGGDPIRFAVEGNRLKLGSIVDEAGSRPNAAFPTPPPVEVTIEKPRDASTDAAAP